MIKLNHVKNVKCVKNHKITKKLLTERMESSINEHHQLDLEDEMYFGVMWAYN